MQPRVNENTAQRYGGTQKGVKGTRSRFQSAPTEKSEGTGMRVTATSDREQTKKIETILLLCKEVRVLNPKDRKEATVTALSMWGRNCR